MAKRTLPLLLLILTTTPVFAKECPNSLPLLNLPAHTQIEILEEIDASNADLAADGTLAIYFFDVGYIGNSFPRGYVSTQLGAMMRTISLYDNGQAEVRIKSERLELNRLKPVTCTVEKIYPTTDWGHHAAQLIMNEECPIQSIIGLNAIYRLNPNMTLGSLRKALKDHFKIYAECG